MQLSDLKMHTNALKTKTTSPLESARNKYQQEFIKHLNKDKKQRKQTQKPKAEGDANQPEGLMVKTQPSVTSFHEVFAEQLMTQNFGTPLNFTSKQELSHLEKKRQRERQRTSMDSRQKSGSRVNVSGTTSVDRSSKLSKVKGNSVKEAKNQE